MCSSDLHFWMRVRFFRDCLRILTPKNAQGGREMSKHSIVRWIKIIGVYLLVAAVAALGWLWCALPEEV